MVQKGPHCPECKQARPSVLCYPQAVAAGEKTVPTVVVYCLNCGCILGVARVQP